MINLIPRYRSETEYNFIMSQRSCYEEELEAMLSIPPEEVKVPQMPVGTFIQEAIDLRLWAEDDREQFLALGLELTFLDALPSRVNALIYAQGEWHNELCSRDPFWKQWQEEYSLAQELYRQLMSSFRFAFRNRPDLRKFLNSLAQGRSKQYFAQKLINLAILGWDQKELLQSVSFDLNLLDQAHATGTRIGKLVATANSLHKRNSKNKELRNRAYTHLKCAMDQVRDMGKYVFRKNQYRRQGYYSPFQQQRGVAQRKRQKEHGISSPTTKEPTPH
ncbi:MAG: hypothetical protein ACEPOZ_17080 [Marinifilaceae bacterium]